MVSDKTIDLIVQQVIQRMRALQPIPVEVSARHVHLSAKAVEALFGRGRTLTPERALSQPGQFLAKERVRLIGSKQVYYNLAVLGPERPECQLEISATDARTLGIAPVCRESGDLAGTPSFTLATDDATYLAPHGAIVARSHIHMHPSDAKALRLQNGQNVSVLIETERPLILKDIIVRVSESYALSIHIDTDEANACFCSKETVGRLMISRS